MPAKGQTVNAETRAKISKTVRERSEKLKQYEALLEAKEQSLWQRIKGWFK